jgi:hypothetical protein
MASGHSSSPPRAEVIIAWEAMPRMRSRTSLWNPFITDKTTTSAMIPRAIPRMEIPEMKEIKWLRRLARV